MSRTLKSETPKKALTILKALEKDVRGVVDPEDRSALDFLITDLQNTPAAHRAPWIDAIPHIVRAKGFQDKKFWAALERLVVLGGLQSDALGTTLEELLAAKLVTDSSARAIVYSLLDLCGMAPTAATISADEKLRAENRLLWLDLIIARLPRIEDAQQLILDAVADGHFSVDDFRLRLSEMRTLGGKRLGDWIRLFRSTLDSSQHAEFDELVDIAFGPLAETIVTGLPDTTADRETLSVRTLALLDPIGASLLPSLAFERWRPEAQKRGPSAETKALTAFLQRAFAYNRDAHLQFSYLAGRKHKAVREALSVRHPDSKQVERAFVTFLEFLNKRFYEATAKNFELLHTYYSTKRGVPPRVCLKGIFRVDASETVVSIFRDHEVDYQKDSDTAIEKNTGFYHIKREGSYFLENNIPRAVLGGRYLNPRLRTDLIRSKFHSGEDLAQLTSSWDQYWVGFTEQRRNDASFYMSTLIVPLTLSAEDLTDEFKKAVPLGDIDRTVFGFLCFDHRDSGYFDESTDVSVGQVFAGFLCHFVFTRLIYTDMSSTFKKVVEFLRTGKGKTLVLPKVDQLAQKGEIEKMRSQPQLENAIRSFVVEARPMRSAPKLQDLDKILLYFAVKGFGSRESVG
jgi:hypothetical protein